MLFINAHAISAGFSIDFQIRAAGQQPVAQLFPAFQGNIDCLCGLVDQAKIPCNGFKGKITSRNTVTEMRNDVRFVQVVTDQRAAGGKVPVDTFGIAGILASSQSFHRCAYIGTKQSGGRYFIISKDGDDTFICAALPVPVAAACCLQNGIQTGHFPVYGGEINIHARFD